MAEVGPKGTLDGVELNIRIGSGDVLVRGREAVLTEMTGLGGEKITAIPSFSAGIVHDRSTVPKENSDLQNVR